MTQKNKEILIESKTKQTIKRSFSKQKPFLPPPSAKSPCEHDWYPLYFGLNDEFAGSFRCSKCNKQRWV